MTDPRQRVVILGHGEMGRAMEGLLARHHDVAVWQRHVPAGATAIDLATAVAGRQFVLFCVPTGALAPLGAQLRSQLEPDSICITIAKGLDDHGRTSAEIFAELFGNRQPYGLMYGPMISEELRAGRPGFAQVGTRTTADFARIAALYRQAPLYLEWSNDFPGLAWAAALKNVYAMLFGIADELKLGDNLRGHLAVGVTGEIAALVTAFGGDPATTYRWAGLGDLITTATSNGSHHHELGRRLARGDRDTLKGEGMHTLDRLRRPALIAWPSYPLLQLIDTCARAPGDTPAAVQRYLESLRP